MQKKSRSLLFLPLIVTDAPILWVVKEDREGEGGLLLRIRIGLATLDCISSFLFRGFEESIRNSLDASG
jgi:hypothetical protein